MTKINEKSTVKVKEEDKQKIKVLWLNLALARKHFNILAAVMGQSLPKHAYSKRIKGRNKKKLTGIHGIKSDKRSKYIQRFNEYMQANLILNNAEKDFSEALAKQKEQGMDTEKLMLV